MASYTCNGTDSCETKVNVGDANPSLVICADCNHGTAVFNCLDFGNHSCDCEICEPKPNKKT